MTERPPPDDAIIAALARIEARLDGLEARVGPLLDRAAELEALLPGAVATAGDTLDGWMAQLEATGAGPDARLRAMGPLVERLSRPETVGRLERLLDRLDTAAFLAESAVFQPPAVSVISQAGESLVETRQESPEPVGLFGALAALGKADVQRALGFGLRFAAHFGRRLAP